MESILRNSRQDWIYIILSTMAGFFMVGLYFFLLDIVRLNPDLALLITLLIFTLFFDVRHLFSTYSRTFLDRSYLRENKSWLWVSFAAILLVPMVSYLVLIQGDFKAYNSSVILAFATRLTLILGFYHLVKQNWGFMAIYKKKFGEPEDGSDRWEKLLLLSGSFLPLAYIAKTTPVWFPGEVTALSPDPAQLEYVISLWEKISQFMLVAALLFLLTGFVLKTKVQYKYVSRNLGFYFLGVFILIRIILSDGPDTILNSIVAGLAILFVISAFISIRKAISFGRFNTGKWAVLITSLILYNGIILLPIENKAIIVMGITIPHNIQYLTFVNFFNSRQYAHSEKDHGFARKMSQKIGLFIVASMVFAFFFELGRTGIRYLNLDMPVDDLYLLRNTVAIVFLSFVLHHYYLDAVIWRVRKDKDLSRTLDK